ncbi:hypothetical protein [Streptomyces sp. NPDC090131]|uniref:hypothetical protein n=1 Tax=Streptomyces sp. NPDC090131 TaxID=3365954 RepID=UPI00380B452F
MVASELPTDGIWQDNPPAVPANALQALAMTAHGKEDLERWSGEPALARAELARAREAVRLPAASLAVRGGPDHSSADAARVEAAARAALGDAYEECFTAAVRDGDGPVGLETVRELARVTLAG